MRRDWADIDWSSRVIVGKRVPEERGGGLLLLLIKMTKSLRMRKKGGKRELRTFRIFDQILIRNRKRIFKVEKKLVILSSASHGRTFSYSSHQLYFCVISFSPQKTSFFRLKCIFSRLKNPSSYLRSR